ncbi:MAG TPA: HlyD family efflux transporter periplasmic adaptor subunit [Vicinamibacteria bacterium]|nr:HlyD family efflux transporter periplasmic adaptor subunit [Vicinamibacteria bacterium]
MRSLARVAPFPIGSLALVASAVLPGCGSGRADSAAPAAPAELRVVAKPVEDVFLLTGELRSVRSYSLVTPRSEGDLQIRWMVEDGSEVREGERLVEFDASRLIQTIEERRLRLRQAENDRESRERSAAAEAEKKRVAVEKAEVEADKARIDAVVPRELRPAVEWSKFQSVWQEKKAALEKARLEREAYAVSSRSEIATALAAEEKARREVAAVEKSLGSMSLLAPKSGIFLVGAFWQWGPEGPRKLQPGDAVWPGYPVGTIPDPSEMEVQAALAESDHGRVAPGMRARCILDTYPDRVFEGRLEEVGSVARESGGRGWFASAVMPGFPVRISLARTDPLMRPGLSVRVEVVRRTWPKALSVPRGAVRFEKEGPVVRRAGGGAVKVRVSACSPVECVVESGLAEGDRVSLF